jgi:hypothetical protein
LEFAIFLPTIVIPSLCRYVISTAVERVPFKELLSFVYYTGSVPRVWSMWCGYVDMFLSTSSGHFCGNTKRWTAMASSSNRQPVLLACGYEDPPQLPNHHFELKIMFYFKVKKHIIINLLEP